jgi:iron complex outermembrane receptor protein
MRDVKTIGSVAAAVTAVLAGTPWADASAQGRAGADSLEEIVVTARKRDENVQDVPVTIDVFSGDELAESLVLRASELQFAVPGFYVQNFETRATITMRGVGAQIAGGTSSVATHVNGIYQASAAAQLNRLFDIERVEVLKGPQGTLYGRNSTGGALNIITRGPGEMPSVDLSAGFGTYDAVRVDGGATLRLSDDWGIRIAGSYLNAGEGRLTNVVTGEKVGSDDFKGGRITLGGKAGEVDVTLFAQYSRDDDNRQTTLIPVNNTGSRAVPSLAWDQTALDSPTESTVERKNLLAGLTLEGDLGSSYKWRAITGYLDYEDASLIDVNPTPNTLTQLVIQFPQFAKQLSQELQLLYTSDRFNWTVGAYYLDDDQSNRRFLTLNPGNLPLFNNSGADETQALAVFADANYALTESLTLNVGARWNRDEVRNSFVGRGLIDGDSFDLSGSESEPTGRLGLDYKANDRWMLYGSVSTGFQTGYFQNRTDALTGNDSPDQVEPEKLTAFEVGSKSILPDDR